MKCDCLNELTSGEKHCPPRVLGVTYARLAAVVFPKQTVLVTTTLIIATPEILQLCLAWKGPVNLPGRQPWMLLTNVSVAKNLL